MSGIFYYSKPRLRLGFYLFLARFAQDLICNRTKPLLTKPIQFAADYPFHPDQSF